MSPDETRASWAGGLLGFAFGGFADGILLHQILQWHHLLSGWAARGTLDALRYQVLWDGLFHAAHYAILAGGLALLWPRPGGPRPDRRRLAAWFALGFGIWHLLDAVLNHWVLGLHRIRQDAAFPLLWDLLFFAIGLFAVALGWRWLRRGGPAAPPAALAALLLMAGAGAAMPPRGAVLVAVALPADAGAEAALLLADRAGAKLAGADASGRVWLLAAADMPRLRRAAVALGATPAVLPAPAIGCLTAWDG